MIKYLFSDVDGTLIKHKSNSIDKNTIQKIKHFINAGNKFYMATGRDDNDIKFLEEKMGISCDYRISQNGTIITSKEGVVIYENHIPNEIAQNVATYLYSLPNIIVEVSDSQKRYGIAKRPPEFHAEFTEKLIILDNIIECISNKTINPIIFLILEENENTFTLIKRYISEHFSGLTAVVTAPGTLEILNAQSSKGNAINFLSKKLNITNNNNIYVVGDNDNDISMFQKYSNSFAMKEAKPQVKQHAKYSANQVGDVIDYINNTNEIFVSKKVVELKNSLILSKISLLDNNFFDQTLIKENNFIVKLDNLDDINVAKKLDIKFISCMTDANMSIKEMKQKVSSLVELGSEIILIDTKLINKELQEVIEYIKQLNPAILLIANIYSIDQAIMLKNLGFHMINITKSNFENLDNKLISELINLVRLPLIFEGNISVEKTYDLFNIEIHSLIIEYNYFKNDYKKEYLNSIQEYLLINTMKL
jgi:Cof subfamily protein (haloacid dehalogenase superfamily)